MASQEPLTEVEEILRCGICLQGFTDPRQLPCGHVFCFECIDRHFKTTDKNCAPCPICRARYWPHKRDANNLTKAIPILHQLMDMTKHVAQECEALSCNTDCAPFLCLTCRQWLCDTCRLQRCLLAENEGDTAHTAFIQTEIDKGLFDVVKRSRNNRCCKHNTHDVEWYCQKCRMLVCKLCKSNSHLHHKLVYVKEQSRETRESLLRTVSSLQEKQGEHSTNYELYKNLEHVKLINFGHCLKMSEYCDSAIASCDNLVQSITHLLTFGSDAVVVNTFLLLEDRIGTELRKCYSMDEDLKEIQKCSGRGFDQSRTSSRTAGSNKSPKIRHNSLNSAIFILNVDRPQACESSNCTNKRKTVLFICMRCRNWICGSCKQRRCSDSCPTDKHEAVRPDDIDRTLYDFIIRSRHDTCNVHSEHVIDQFCYTCNVLICKVCKTGHLHHNVVGVTTRSRESCDQMEGYQERLQKQIKDYSTTRDTFMKMQEESCSELLSPSYCATVVGKCDSGLAQCNILYRDITSLLLYGSHRVIVEMFGKMDAHVEIQLKETPLEYMRNLERFASLITESLDTDVMSGYKG